jgi:DNA-binding NtrC family response regulator
LPARSTERPAGGADASTGGAGHGRDAFHPRPLVDVEREHVLRTLEAVDGNRSRAAELLGIGRNTLLRKLKEYGVAR